MLQDATRYLGCIIARAHSSKRTEATVAQHLGPPQLSRNPSIWCRGSQLSLPSLGVGK